MSLSQDVASFGAGSAVKNRVSAPLATIRGLAPQISILNPLFITAGECATLLTAFADLAEPRHLEILGKMPVALPVMQAVYSADQRLGSGPAEQSFPAYFTGLTNAESKITATRDAAQTALTSLATIAVTFSGVSGTGSAALTSLISVVPAPTIPDPMAPGSTIANPDYTSFQSTNATKLTSMQSLLTSLKTTVTQNTTDITALHNGVDASYQAGLNKLKGLSLIQFLASSHPPDVQAAITNNIELSMVPTLP